LTKTARRLGISASRKHVQEKEIGQYSYSKHCYLVLAAVEALTAATAEAASELESADEPPPGTAIPAEWGLAMRIVVSDEWRMNSEKFVPNVTKKTSSQVYNSVMHTLSIYTENTGNHCILTPFSFLRGAAFAWGSYLS
jgi:hypothetical protein